MLTVQSPATPASTNAESGSCELIERVVVFGLAAQRYAIPVERVQEIQQIVAFSDAPTTGTGVVGMVDLRGCVIPVVDLRLLVGLPAAPYTLATPMLVCIVGENLVAVVVDDIADVLGLPHGCIQEPPALHPLAACMLGVARMESGLAYVLDVDVLLGSEAGAR